MSPDREGGTGARFSVPAVWRGLIAHPNHGPLPAFLLVLTLVSGVVDAVSILRLGQVFVSNMTGNVVILGFALGDAPGFSLTSSLSAIFGFLLGAAAWGVLTGRRKMNRAVLLRT